MGKKERRRRQQLAKSKRKGALIGMRSGFKNVAQSVAGAPDQRKAKKSSWMSTAFTIVLVAAAAAFLYYRRGGF